MDFVKYSQGVSCLHTFHVVFLLVDGLEVLWRAFKEWLASDDYRSLEVVELRFVVEEVQVDLGLDRRFDVLRDEDHDD